MYIGRPQKTGPYIKLDDISSQFNGSDVTFSLTSGGSPFYADNPYTVSVSLNGVVQEPVSAYTIVRDQITFASPPSAASDFFAVVYGTTVNRELRNATSLATGVDIIVGSISADNITSSGVVTATSFEGDGSQLTGIDATALKDPNGTVRVQANESGAVVTGVLTSTSFEGPLTGNVTGNATGLSGTPDIVVGTVTAVDASFSGNVSIAGTLTYEDVTNIDSIGLITARSGVHIGIGVTYTEDLVVDGDARVTGILTIGTGTVTIDGDTNTVNVGTALTLSHTNGVIVGDNNLHTSGFNVNNINATGITTLTTLDVSGHTELDQLNFSGIATISGDGTNAYLRYGSVNAYTNYVTTYNVSQVGGIPLISVSANNVALSANTTLNAAYWRLRTLSDGAEVNGNLTISGPTGGGLSVSGVSTFTGLIDSIGIIAARSDVRVEGNLSSIGITTLASAGGITTTGGDLYVSGNANVSGVITATDFDSLSDINFKTNISSINNPLDKIVQIRGVDFEWKEDSRMSMGVIAQEVEKVFPQLVHGQEVKTVNYNGLIGLLIECVKKQQLEIEELKKHIP